MEILLLLLPISAGLLILAGWAFVWCVNNGQFDALDQHALDIFKDDIAAEDSVKDNQPAQNQTAAASTSNQPEQFGRKIR